MRRALAAAWLLGLNAAAPAAEPVEAGLTLAWHELDLRADGTPLETELSRVGITLWEDVLDRLRMGLEGGLLLGSQSGNPIADGLDLQGGYGALAAELRLLQAPGWSIDLGAQYAYHELDDELSSQALRLRWHQLRAQLGVTARLDALRLSGGGYVAHLEGDEIARGAVTRTRELELGEKAGAFAAADYWVDPTGRVSLRVDTGALQGLRVEFARQF